MVSNADKIGTAVTVGNDSRITKVGSKLRHLRLDELPQVFDVLSGDMSFVGTRPEAVKYVEKYQPVFMATLLMPAGITSEASIRYKDEDELLDAANDVDKVYVEQVLPAKMKWNLETGANGTTLEGDRVLVYDLQGNFQDILIDSEALFSEEHQWRIYTLAADGARIYATFYDEMDPAVLVTADIIQGDLNILHISFPYPQLVISQREEPENL